jgi:site-specific DNA-methyltransferase (adenine-specific)
LLNERIEMEYPEHVVPTDIVVSNRIRLDKGDVEKMISSIKEFGLIEPIILRMDNNKPTLVAGGRRLEAIIKLAWPVLEHGMHFLWRDESRNGDAQTKLYFTAMELEENVCRKDLSWTEQVEAKQKLYEIMQEIHGVPKLGPAFKGTIVSDKQFPSGFGISQLSAMLGESVGKTSQDLQLAEMIKRAPHLKQLETKAAALTKLKVAGAVAVMAVAAQVRATQQASKDAVTVAAGGVAQPPKQRSWTLYEGDFRDNASQVEDNSVDLILTDLPYGSDVHDTHKTGDHYVEFDDSSRAVQRLLKDIAEESYRVLRSDRYVAFFFGFRFYTSLIVQLELAGFDVNPVPAVWIKGTKFGVNPTAAYCIGYEPILIARKGSPVLIRPGASNVMEFPPPTRDVKMHLVEKPVPLLQRLMLDMTGPSALIVDFCAGTGSTGVAAHQIKRTSVLFEIEPQMIMMAKARLEAL